MKIANGPGDKVLSIRISARELERGAELWIEFSPSSTNQKPETLSYMTLDELLDLKQEIQEAINKVVSR